MARASEPNAARAALLVASLLAAVARAEEDEFRPALRGAPSPLEQVLVMDAGSSGTRVHIFNLLVPAGKFHVPNVDQEVRATQTLKVKPGLSHFAEHGDFDGVQHNMEQLLAFADKFVAPERRASTPVLLKATAGLRAVPAEKAELVLQRVRSVLGASAYLSHDNWVSIIPGKEEGGLAWVAANYLAGTFVLKDGAAEGADSVGIIEMGGGSTQVTFEVGEEPQLQEEDSFVLTTALGRRYRLYAHSYLGYGQDHAQSHLKELLPTTAEVVEDPCYPVGWEYKRPGGVGVTAHGIGNFEGCEAAIREHLLVGNSAPGRYASEPPLKGRFLATENFWYTRNDLTLPMEGDATAMASAAKGVCSSPAPAPPGPGEGGGAGAPPEEPRYCFALSYQAAFMRVLREARQADPVGGDFDVRIARKVGGGELDWALGAALVHSLESRRERGDLFIASPLAGPTVSLHLLAALLPCLVLTGLLLRCTARRLGVAEVEKVQ